MTIKFLKDLVDDDTAIQAFYKENETFWAGGIFVIASANGIVFSGELIKFEDYVAQYVKRLEKNGPDGKVLADFYGKNMLEKRKDWKEYVFFTGVTIEPGHIEKLDWCVPMDSIEGLALIAGERKKV